jgi:hypothetical protein
MKIYIFKCLSYHIQTILYIKYQSKLTFPYKTKKHPLLIKTYSYS